MSIKSALVMAAVLSADPADASCSLPTQFAPNVPALEKTTYASVRDLRAPIQHYIDSEQHRLERCRASIDAPRFNLRVMQLQSLAREYNALVRFYNRVANELAGGAPLPRAATQSANNQHPRADS